MMAKMKYGFYRVYESIHIIMAGINALLGANTIVAMIDIILVLSWYYLSSKSGSRQAVSLLNVSIFTICKVKLLLATFISHAS